MKGNEGIAGNTARNELTGQRTHASTVKCPTFSHLLALYLTPCNLMMLTKT